MPTGHYKRSPRVERVAILCSVCGTMRSVLPSFAARVTGSYCSSVCAGEASRTLSEKSCEHCGVVFRPQRKTTRFCSNQCRSAARRSANPKWEDPEYVREYSRNYQHSYRIRTKNRHANARADAKEKADAVRAGDLRAIFAKAEKRCVYCGEQSSRLTIDHCTPISRGGDHIAENLVPCCKSCNSSKGTKDLADWLDGRHGFMGLARAVVFLERNQIDRALYPVEAQP